MWRDFPEIISLSGEFSGNTNFWIIGVRQERERPPSIRRTDLYSGYHCSKHSEPAVLHFDAGQPLADRKYEERLTLLTSDSNSTSSELLFLFKSEKIDDEKPQHCSDLLVGESVDHRKHFPIQYSTPQDDCKWRVRYGNVCVYRCCSDSHCANHPSSSIETLRAPSGRRRLRSARGWAVSQLKVAH